MKIFQLPIIRNIIHGWKQFAKVLGKIQTRVLITLVYFGMVSIYSFFLWLFRKDLLKQRKRALKTFWVDWRLHSGTIKEATREF